jgi:transmembrane sensor
MIDELLVKQMLGECNASEAESIKAWLAASEANKKRYRDFEWLWIESRKLASKKEVDVDAAWERFTHMRNSHAHPKAGKVISLLLVKKYAASIAAICILVLGLTLLLKWMQRPAQEVVPFEMLSIHTFNETKTDTLPDGTIVTLNKNSNLLYPNKFSDTLRKIILEGEAFFNVVSNPAKPFLVEAGKLEVKVLGTTFNVINRVNVSRVVVESGRVEVGFMQKKEILSPNQQVTVSGKDSSFRIEPVNNVLYKYYRTREFICDNTPLITLVESLREAYDTDIILETKAIENLRITATFRQEPLDSILEIVAQTLGIKAIKNGNQIILR